MKISIKHIAPYLPYGLNIMNACIKDVGNDYKSIMDITTLKVVLNGGYGLFVSKPILSPLSYITKEIGNNNLDL